MKRRVIIIVLIIICLSILLFSNYRIGIKQSTTVSQNTTVLGEYYGISEGQKWETSFTVFENEDYDNDIMVKGYVMCLDDELMKQYRKDEIQKCFIAAYQANDKGMFSGNFIYDTDRFRIIIFAADKYEPYERMVITIGRHTTEININKINN